jgi:hypothetical protein
LLRSNAGASRTGKMTRGRLELTPVAEALPQPPGRMSCSATQNGSFARPSSLGPVSRG